MVNPSELRIGNVILFNNQPIMVHGIRTNGVLLDGILYNTGDPLHQFDYELIYAEDQRLQPLNIEDLLLEQILGVYQVNNRQVYIYSRHQRGNFFISYEEGGYFVGMYNGDQLIHISPSHFRSYHQLQNIHYAQYGEELDVDFETLKNRWTFMNDRAR